MGIQAWSAILKTEKVLSHIYVIGSGVAIGIGSSTETESEGSEGFLFLPILLLLLHPLTIVSISTRS